MQSVDHIIYAKWLIPIEGPQPVLENYAFVIQNGFIKDFLPAMQVEKNYTAKSVEHYDTHAVLPGFTNAHTHLAMNMFRGLADDLALMKWLNYHIWPAEKKWLSHEFVYDTSLFAMAEMIRSGTTCFNDMFFFPHTIAEAANIAGIRGAVSVHVIDFPTPWTATTEESFAKGLDLLQEYKKHPLIRVTVAPHAIYTVTDKNLIKVREFSETHDLKINMHVHETVDEINQSLKLTGQRPLRRLNDMGLVSPRLIAVHMIQINEEDLDILEAGHPTIVHCPQSNMKLASGACPVSTLQARGLQIALGTDSAASNNDLNMLDEMRAAALLAKHTSQNPENLPASETLKLATINGAEALGISSMTGSLAIGKSADFIAINLEEIETLPVYHPVSQIVYSASPHQVTDVWVAGKPLLKNRRLTTLDEEALRDKAKYWGKKIASG
jgi:5-methylthioadenosine/S-adenosylhomocysteine deaminase